MMDFRSIWGTILECLKLGNGPTGSSGATSDDDKFWMMSKSDSAARALSAVHLT
jgi:hypothetical protein